MKYRSRILSGILALTLVSPAFSIGEKENKNSSSILGALYSPDKDQILGDILKAVLENYHISKKRLNNDLSENAFEMYLERVDYGKQFLTKKDVESLEKFEEEFDDMLSNGDLSVIKKTEAIMSKRIPFVSSYVKKLLEGKFDFTKKEEYETDPKKREYAESESELKERWRKLIKLEVLVQYFDLKDEQEGLKKDKDGKKKKAVEKSKRLGQKELVKKAQEKVAKRYNKIFKRLMTEKRNDRIDKFYNSITRIYDPHTHYYMPEEKEDFDIDMTGKLEGIGALLREDGSYIKVERIIPGSASWRGKELKAEDIILAVGQEEEEPVDIVDMSIREAVKLIRGPKGTTVKLKVKRVDGTTKTIAIVRDEVVIEDAYVKSTILKHKKLNKRIGYIHVPKFYRDFQKQDGGRNCSDDVKKEIAKLKKAKVDAIILNLRNNGGGALTDATNMSGLFFGTGPVVQVKGQSSKPKVNRDEDPTIQWDKPLVILVNRFSASASEIVAGAMKDYGRAVVVGTSEQTHGKGTVQAIYPMNAFINPIQAKLLGDLGAIKVTTDMFYRVNGKSTQFEGIKPHIVLPDEYGFLDSGEKELEYAIPFSEVPATKYKKWTKHSYNIEKLKKNSEKRVKENEKFQKIIKSVEWSNERKDKSKRLITMENIEKFRAENRKMSEKYKVDSVNEDIIVESTNKLKDENDKERFKEFKEELQKDPAIEETLYIIQDMLS